MKFYRNFADILESVSSATLSFPFKRQNPLFECKGLTFKWFCAHHGLAGARERRRSVILLRDEKDKMHLFEKTKIGSARKRSASRPNLLETPAGHEVFVIRRYCFAPARRRPIDQLDWGSPAGSRRIARKDGVSNLVQMRLFPPTGGQERKR